LPIVALWMALFATTAWAKEPARLAILLTPHPAYHSPLAAIEVSLKKQGVAYTIVELPKINKETQNEKPRRISTQQTASADILRQLTAKQPSLLVTIGTSATAFAVENVPDIPIVFCLVPNAQDMAFMVHDSTQRARSTGVTSDISPGDQVKWLKDIDPKARNIGLLHSSRSQLTAEMLVSAGKKHGIQIKPIVATRKDFPQAIDALNLAGCDGVLMIPDANVYNSTNVQRLLLWGLRKKKPVWTFSANIVKAGAIAGSYSSPHAIGRQTAEIIERFISGERIAKIGLQYPKHVEKAVNYRTAEMIGLTFSQRVIQTATKQYEKDG